MAATIFQNAIKGDPHGLTNLWNEAFEARALWGNRIFCLTFLVCYPSTSILYYLNGNPNYRSIFLIQLACSGLVAGIIFLHFRGKLNSQHASFYSRILLIIFHSFILARFQTLYYYDLSINLTLQLIFSIWVLHWKFSYALISSVATILFFSLALYIKGADVLVHFLKEGGFFYFLGQSVFPLVLQMRYNKQYREFIYFNSLQRQNKELEKQNQLAREAMQAKSDFLSTMSHEIRTPLNGIVGVIHLMLQEELRTDFQRELVGTLKFSSDHLMAVVNDVLDFNKINSNHVKLAREPFDLYVLLKNLEKTFIPRAQEKGLNLIFDIDPALPAQLTGDQVRLNQVFTNLIHNAVKFTEKGFVKLAVKEQKRDETRISLHFEISDSGVGIASEDQSSIFEIFIQSSSEAKRGNRGTGIGLAITRELLRLFGSEIKLESEEGLGSNFSFDIEFDYSNQQLVVEKPARVTVAIPDARILVVDDNAVNLLFATNLLKKIGLQYDKAQNGCEAVERFNNQHYDLVLMDLKMPVMNGFEATQLIRAQGSTTPIVALTASAFTDERDKALANGFSGYLAKPYVPGDLYDILFTFLKTEDDSSLPKPQAQVLAQDH
ncbi:response regulator [Dyadobacter chenhuakuii]|uniref:histidine kinase n=1 Tax=Dyadobacter chenhuakuii TaxID=2909339 RepID=A0ABY4XQZ3_9BACT|nr:response regulator [Dyadobacter chenhuakuii]MCF2492954.1 response regulator [Dyadobacter chenhuakuii]USJ32757.1 response regulator [Dyadobacter chenhuakuii]